MKRAFKSTVKTVSPRGGHGVRAFTLVELLVVVAIISALAAIMLPSLRNARYQARRVKCQANLKQIGVAWHMYLQESNGHFYQGVNADFNFGGRQGLVQAQKVPKPLNPYLGLPLQVEEGADVFRCPSDRGGPSVEPTAFSFYGTSYMTNLMLVGQDAIHVDDTDPCLFVLLNVSRRLKNLNRSSVANDSKLVLTGDFGWWQSYERGSDDRVEWHRQPSMYNVVFMDGHVDFVRFRKGLHVTPDYTVIPFAGLSERALGCQKEGPAE